MKKVLILGVGFAGIQTAIELQKKKMFEVTLGLHLKKAGHVLKTDSLS
jgi:NADH dehydrogenase FAD-containing subunit